VLILPLFAAALAYGQFTSGVSLVEVYATVTDRSGQPVPGLTASDFSVLEDGTPQAITAFAAGNFPLSLAIAIDRSFSMTAGHDRVPAVKTAARALVNALRAEDQVMILAIGSGSEIVAPLATDRRIALRAIEALEPWGTTPLYDAIPIAIDATQRATGRRALVIFSDGRDRYSDTTAAQLLEFARRHDVLVYPIAVGDARPPLFTELAAATGGRSLFVRNASRDLTDEATGVARELRWQYLLGYKPRSEPAGWHAIDVRVNRADVRVRARDGYGAR